MNANNALYDQLKELLGQQVQLTRAVDEVTLEVPAKEIIARKKQRERVHAARGETRIKKTSTKFNEGRWYRGYQPE